MTFVRFPLAIAPTLGLLLGAGTIALGWKSSVLIAGVALICWMTVNPVWCLYILVATIPIVLDFGGGFTLTRILGPVALLLVFFNAATGRVPWPQPFRWPDGVLLSAYFSVALLSVSYAPNRAEAISELGPLVVFLGLSFLTLVFVRDREQLVRLAWLMVWVAIAEAVLTIAQIRFRFVLPGAWRPSAMLNIDIQDAGFRADGTTTHPILLAGFLQMTLPFLILLFVQTRRMPLKLLFLVSLPVVLYAWTSTYARSSMIAMAGMALVALAITSRIGRWLASAITVATLVVLAAHGMSIEAVLHSIEDIELFGSAFEYADLYGSVESFRFRVESWAGGLNTFLTVPLTGVGLGQAKELYVRFLPPWATSPVHPTVIHNAFLECAAELGILGVSAFLGLWIHAFASLAGAWRDPQLSAFARTLFVVLVGQAVFLFFTPMVRDIWLTLALAIAIGRMARPVPEGADGLR
jgi:O-antigen ligase